MHILVTGAAGLLGSNVVSKAVEAGYDVLGTYHTDEPNLSVPCRQLNATDYDAFCELLDEYKPDVVVNCAAKTDVDGCESDPELAEKVNGRAPGNMSAACADRDVAFVQISTDYVFDGKNEMRYGEDADVNPLQVYGRSKLIGERRVRENFVSPLIVRLSFVYGVHGATSDLEGFPAWVVSKLEAEEKIPLFVDQHVTPSRAGQAAETLLTLVADDSKGTYHVACRECVTPYEFGETICGQIDADVSLLTESTTTDVSRPAPRPTHTCLNVERVEKRLGRRQPSLSEDVRAIRSALKTGVD